MDAELVSDGAVVVEATSLVVELAMDAVVSLVGAAEVVDAALSVVVVEPAVDAEVTEADVVSGRVVALVVAPPVLRFGETCLLGKIPFGKMPRGGEPAVATDMMRTTTNARSVSLETIVIFAMLHRLVSSAQAGGRSRGMLLRYANERCGFGSPAVSWPEFCDKTQ